MQLQTRSIFNIVRGDASNLLKQLCSLTSSYDQMISRIRAGTFIFTFCFNWLLFLSSNAYRNFFTSLMRALQINDGSMKIDLGMFSASVVWAITYLLVPTLLSFLSSSLTLHNKISNWFDIRLNFDVDHILFPLLKECATDRLALWTIKPFLSKSRHDLMRKTFYKYASYTKPQIDLHLILMALTNWSLYWICLESMFWGLLFAALMVSLSETSHFSILLCLLVPLGFGLKLFYGRAVLNAWAEIMAITENDTRRNEIKAVFEDALRDWGISY